MDVERVQKINNLALDLMKQGLAKDRDDAIAQAERTFRERDSDEYTTMRETMQEIKTEREPLPESAESEPTADLSQDEIKNILKQNTEFVVKKFKEFQEKIASMEREINTLRTKLTYNRLPTAEQVSSQREEPKSEEITVEEAATPPSQPKETTTPSGSHPRSGNYNEDDVSIEKFFYMGTK